MIILGVILLLIGLFVGIPILLWLGIILAVVGAALWLFGPVGASGTRRRYY